MLNDEKIHLMTRLALYEKNEGKKTIPIGKYDRKDYIAMKMLQTAFTTAIAYFCILGLWVLGMFEELLEGLSDMNYVLTGFYVVLGFVALELVFLIIAYKRYSRKYTLAKKSLKPYFRDLKYLKKYY